MELNEIIKAGRLARGWSMEEFARRIAEAEGLKKPLAWQTVQQWERPGGTAPKRRRLEVVASLLGMTTADLLSGKLPSEQADEVDLDSHPDLSSVRTVKLKLQAGVSGFAVEPLDENDGPPIFFRNDWLRQRGFKPYNLLALKIGGMSMVPTLYPDDMVVVHIADTEPKDGEVYAVNYEGEAVIKRMKRERGSWWLSSDNTDKARYPDKECLDGSCIVIGHVIHRQSERI